MNPRLKPEVEAAFAAALELPRSERTAFLAREYESRPELRTEVESLLRAYQDAGSFLEPDRPLHRSNSQWNPPILQTFRPKPGTPLGSYEIVGKIGEGGMGEVFRAHDTRLNRPVAIKFLHAEVADENARHRFQREAQAASSLNHPNILTLYEVGEFEGRQYLITEFIDGCNLREWARKTQPSVRQIAELLSGVAEALACAHNAGIIHRDVKPENILVSKNGYAKLVDFGLAKLMEPPDSSDIETRSRGRSATRPGVILGTVAYMSPEQAAGKSADRRSDIFAFGVVLYELLAGERPFTGKSDVDVMYAVLHKPPRPLAELRPDAPVELRVAVEKALEKEPGDRHQSMCEMAVDLRRVRQFARLDVTAAATTTRGRLRLLPRVAVAMLAAAMPAVWWFGYRGASSSIANPLANAQFTRLTDFPGTELDAAISQDGRFAVFLADRDGPFDIFLTQVGTGRFINLTQGSVPDLHGSLRGVGFSGDGSEIWFHQSIYSLPLRIMPLLGGTPRVLLGPPAQNVAWNHDGTQMIFHTLDPGDPMFVAGPSGGNPHKIFAARPDVHNHFPAWSPDGRWIYFSSGNPIVNEMDLWRISPTGGMPERLTRHNSYVAYPAPINNSTVLYVARDADGAGPWLWSLDVERKVSRRISFGLERYTSVAASGDGRRLVATVANPDAKLWSVPILDRLAGERDVKPYPLPSVRALMPRFGGDSLFYISSRGAGDGLWRYRNGEATEIWKGATGGLLEPPGVSADGRHVAFVVRRNGNLRLRMDTADGTDPRDLADSLAVRGAPCWSPDGKWIAIGGHDEKGDGLFKISVEGGTPVRLTSGPAANPAWSSDGTLIVYAGADVGGLPPLLAVRPDGTRAEWPPITVQRDGERIRFLPSGSGLIYMQGEGSAQDFWMLDLATKSTRRLAHLTDATMFMRTFDVTPDGKQIVFDRLRENSDIALIDLPR